MLASTMQHSTHHHTPTHHNHHHTPQQQERVRWPGPRDGTKKTTHHRQVSPQDPTACQTPHTPQEAQAQSLVSCSTQPHPTDTNHRHGHEKFTKKENPSNHRTDPNRPEQQPQRLVFPTRGKLLRKEVIQPHLPVRLPCYDFVPIAGPTFDHSPPQAGWAMGFGCYQLS
jgi:hypothetical protein